MNRVMAMSSCALVAACAASASATLVTFTGGTVTRLDSTTQITNTTVTWDNVDYYEEGGYRLDFQPNGGSAGFASHVGSYYGPGNDVIHGHWLTGGLGGLTTIAITQIAPGTFDLNYFTLTSNTDLGGGPASGNELAWVRGFNSNVPTGPAVLLPVGDWGFPGIQIGLGSDFDAVDRVEFYVTNTVVCFGMDDFYINEIPAPGSVALLGMLGGLALRRRR
ncbi:MAG: hypothetical protein HUU18_12860 [Phycisphaerales bacterium]|nr:hypothetical protein [Phycisphaerales bacterium]